MFSGSVSGSFSFSGDDVVLDVPVNNDEEWEQWPEELLNEVVDPDYYNMYEDFDEFYEVDHSIRDSQLRESRLRRSNFNNVVPIETVDVPEELTHRNFLVYVSYHSLAYGKEISKRGILDEIALVTKAEFIFKNIIEFVLNETGSIGNGDVVVLPDCLIYVNDDLNIAARVAVYFIDAIKTWNDLNGESFELPIGSVVVDYGKQILFDTQNNYCTSVMLEWCRDIDIDCSSQDVCFSKRFSKEEIDYLKQVLLIREYDSFYKVKESFIDIDFNLGDGEEDNIFHTRMKVGSKERKKMDVEIQEGHLEKKAILYLSYTVDMDHPNPVPHLMDSILQKYKGEAHRGYYVFSSLNRAYNSFKGLEDLIHDYNEDNRNELNQLVELHAAGLDVSPVIIYKDIIFGNAVYTSYILATKKNQNGRLLITSNALEKLDKPPEVVEIFYPQIPVLCYISVPKGTANDLHDSDIIENDFVELDSLSQSSGEISLLDVLPLNVQTNLFRYFGEEDIGRLSRVSKPFRHVSTDTSIWIDRLDSWNINLYSLGDRTLLTYDQYILRYREHKENERRRIEDERWAEEQRLLQIKIDKTDTNFRRFFFNGWVLDIPAIVLTILFTVFIALKLDNIFTYSWHFVFMPIYVMFGWGIMGLALFDIHAMIYGLDELTTYTKKIRKGISIASLGVAQNKKGYGRFMMYNISGMLLTSAVMCAEYSDSRSIPAIAMTFPFGIISFFVLYALMAGTIKSCGIFVLILPLSYWAWFLIFIIFKAIGIFGMSWYVALLPLWIVLGIIAPVVLVRGLITLECTNTSSTVVGLSAPFALASFFIWLLFLCESLEQLHMTGSTDRSWIGTFIPLWITLLYILIMGVFIVGVKSFRRGMFR